MKSSILKFMAAITIAVSCVYAVNTVAYAATYKEYTEPEKFVQLYETSVNMDILGNVQEPVTCYFYNNRLCVPIRYTVEALGGTLETDADGTNYVITINDTVKTFPVAPAEGNRITTLYVDGVGYIYMYDLLEAFNFTPSFNVDSNSVTIYKKATSMTADLLTAPEVETKAAYLRLEDITASGLDYSSPVYSDKNLEKLRTMAEYLYLRGQEYYIAWIPYYANPGYSVWNDLTESTNLYNSCFMYTLDYMVEHGGHLGVHGYSHQYNNVKSGEGWEWGSNTPYSLEQQQDRMIAARQTGERLGFDVEFFEFPHYGATAQQLEMAEQYFDVIYQAYPNNQYANNIYAHTNSDGKTVYYVPTPADYMYSAYDGSGILSRLKNCVNTGKEVSLFYHPSLEFGRLSYSVSDDYTKTWFVSSSCILTQIVNQVMADGYSFKEFSFAK